MKVLIDEGRFPNELIRYSGITGSLGYVHFKVFLKKHDFTRLIFSFKKFEVMGTKALFLSFQNSFSVSYFPISQEPLNQNSSLISLWNNN